MKTILLTLPSLLVAAALPAVAQNEAPPPPPAPPAPPADVAKPAEELAKPAEELAAKAEELAKVAEELAKPAEETAEAAEESEEPTVEVTAVGEVTEETPGTVSFSVAQTTAKEEGGGTVTIEGGSGSVDGRLVLRSPEKDGTVNVIELGDKKMELAKVSADTFAFHRAEGPVTFMGVSVTPAGPELSVHLPLDQGTGLVIQSVSKDSPAEKAGLKESDIITKLDDQLLIHPVQFSVLVARKKEGDIVKLSLLRKGERQEIPVTLGKNDQADVAGGPAQLRIGDVAIQVGGADSGGPVRTLLKRVIMKDGKTKEEIVVDGPEAKFDGKALERLRLFKAAQADKVREEVKQAADAAAAAKDEVLRLKDDVAQQKALTEAVKIKVLEEKRAADVAQDLAKYQADVASQYKKLADGRAAEDASKEQLIRALRQALESLEKQEGK